MKFSRYTCSNLLGEIFREQIMRLNVVDQRTHHVLYCLEDPTHVVILQGKITIKLL